MNRSFLITGIIIAISVFLISYKTSRYNHLMEQHNLVVDSLRSAKETIFKAQVIIDSLHDESFNNSTIVGRYEIALGMFREQNPAGADSFQLILSTKTE